MGTTPLVAVFGSAVVLQLSPDALDFSWLRGVLMLAAYMLLPAVGLVLTRLRGSAGQTRILRYSLVVLMAVLSVVVMHYNGLLSWPGWLGSSLVFFVPCAAIGVAAALAINDGVELTQ